MTQQVSMVTKGSCSKRGMLSLEEVRAQTQAYWLHLSTASTDIATVHRLFKRQKMPCPAPYKHAVATLNTLHRSVRGFCGFLDKSTRLPLAICGAHYPLIKALHLMDAQLGELEDMLISLLCMSGQLSPQEIISLSQDVRQKLKELQQSWNRVRRGTQALLNRTQISQDDRPPLLAESNIIEFGRRKANLQRKRSWVL